MSPIEGDSRWPVSKVASRSVEKSQKTSRPKQQAVIIGAGIIGCALAFELASIGYRVLTITGKTIVHK